MAKLRLYWQAKINITKWFGFDKYSQYFYYVILNT